MDRRARPLSELWPRALRFFAIALLIGWCVATAWEFGRRMRGPAGLFVFRTPGTEGAVGMPLPGAHLVTTVRAMLAGHDDSRPWLLVVPSGTDPFVATYIRYQLAYIAYPRRVDVATPENVGGLGAYASVVALPGGLSGDEWRAVEGRDGWVRYERVR